MRFKQSPFICVAGYTYNDRAIVYNKYLGDYRVVCAIRWDRELSPITKDILQAATVLLGDIEQARRLISRQFLY